MEPLDLTDRKIIHELDRNARTGYSEIGRKIRVPKETVKYRIAQMERRGIIRGYYTVMNFSKLGYQIYRIYLRLQNLSARLEREIIGYLATSPRVAVLYRINGAYHLAAGVWARNIWEYEEFWHTFKTRYGAHLSAAHSSVMTEYFEFTRPYLLPGRAPDRAVFPTVSAADPEHLDETDRRLLESLSDNARAPMAAVARSLSVTLVTARHRLRRLLQKKVIVGFRAIFDLQALGREYYKVDVWFSRFDRAEAIRQKMLAHPCVAYTERSLIAGDLEFDIEAESFGQFITIMDALRTEFPEDIREYTYYSRIQNYKTRYAPAFRTP